MKTNGVGVVSSIHEGCTPLILSIGHKSVHIIKADHNNNNNFLFISDCDIPYNKPGEAGHDIHKLKLMLDTPTTQLAKLRAFQLFYVVSIPDVIGATKKHRRVVYFASWKKYYSTSCIERV